MAELARILLVEDDDIDARALKRAFKKSGIENTLIRVTNGQEALDELANGTLGVVEPVILIVDLNMPVMGGLELLQKLRDTPAVVPFILSSSEDDADMARCYQQGAVGYVVKDLDIYPKLVSLVQAYNGAVTVRMPR